MATSEGEGGELRSAAERLRSAAERARGELDRRMREEHERLEREITALQAAAERGAAEASSRHAIEIAARVDEMVGDVRVQIDELEQRVAETVEARLRTGFDQLADGLGGESAAQGEALERLLNERIERLERELTHDIRSEYELASRDMEGRLEAKLETALRTHRNALAEESRARDADTERRASRLADEIGERAVERERALAERLEGTVAETEERLRTQATRERKETADVLAGRIETALAAATESAAQRAQVEIDGRVGRAEKEMRRAAGEELKAIERELERRIDSRIQELSTTIDTHVAERLTSAETRMAKVSATARSDAEQARAAAEERIAAQAEKAFRERADSLEMRLADRSDSLASELRSSVSTEISAGLDRVDAKMREDLAADVTERATADVGRVAAEHRAHAEAAIASARSEAEAGIAGAQATAHQDVGRVFDEKRAELIDVTDRKRAEMVDSADREFAQRLAQRSDTERERTQAWLSQTSQSHAEYLGQAAATGEKRIADYVAQNLTRAARKQELKLARQERERRIREAEKRVEREGEKVIQRAREQAEAEARRSATAAAQEAAAATMETATANVTAAAGVRLRQDVEQLVGEAREELRQASARLEEAEKRARAEAGATAQRGAALAEAAEARVRAAADAAGAEAASSVWATADAVWKRIEHESKVQATRRQLESVLERFREADRRLRQKEARLRAAALPLIEASKGPGNAGNGGNGHGHGGGEG